LDCDHFFIENLLGTQITETIDPYLEEVDINLSHAVVTSFVDYLMAKNNHRFIICWASKSKARNFFNVWVVGIIRPLWITPLLAFQKRERKCKLVIETTCTFFT